MITGAKQSFAGQTGTFGFQFDITSNNLNSPVNVGFSGNTVLNFQFLNGKIYDPSGLYIGSYQNNLKTIISGEIGANSFDYYINDNPIAFGRPKSTGYFDNFYVQSQSGVPVNFNATIMGQIPSYTLNNNFLFVPGQLATGSIINNEILNTFKLFSGETFSSNLFYSGCTTNLIAPSGSGLYYTYVFNATPATSYSFPFTLNTNFGDVSFILNLNSTTEGGTGSYTNLSIYQPNFGGISGAPLTTGSNTGPLSYFSVSGLEYSNTPFLDVYLISGSGQGPITGNVVGTGIGEILVSGYVTGSGIATGIGTGNISGYGGLYNTNLYTGFNSGLISQVITGSGFYSQVISGQITGNINGILYNKTISGWNLKTGIDSSNLIDFKLNNYVVSSGYMNPSGPITNLSGNSLYIEVDYMSYPDYNYEYMNLVITGQNTGIIIQITGGRT